VIEAFLARRRRSGGGAERLPLPDGCSAQELPGAERDGFYYALIRKPA
jgi:hypothetical protein